MAFLFDTHDDSCPNSSLTRYFYKNKSNTFNRCPNNVRYSKGLIINRETGETHQVTHFGRCKRWDCPYCGPINKRAFQAKLERGVTELLEEAKRKGFSMEYGMKFLTLTVPGQEWRDSHTIEEARDFIISKFQKVIYQIRRKWGAVEYAWAIEEQRDGYPHIHVLLIGRSIAPKKRLEQIKKLWRKQQGMGFIRMNKVSGGAAGIAAYLSKYMAKGMLSGGKRHHVYGLSKGFYAAQKRVLAKFKFILLETGTYSVGPGEEIAFRPDRVNRRDPTADIDAWFLMLTSDDWIENGFEVEEWKKPNTKGGKDVWRKR